ncbi:bifunctional DNA primase/polymerase [Microbacterium sp. CIAB417]|uniref:bifunctional DNA primase/polymerase n=1 Tax=Microbacterium sp. CIAB417 TaxID=2860287 RepID=UPI001FACE5BD|nr:bifunctional DNA primase/polymerase [Microbacterium sp. CIAB417]
MVKAPDYAISDAEQLVTNPALAMATHWATQGWPTFPLRHHDKTPAIPSAHKRESGPKCDGRCGKLGHGVHDADRDPAKLARLFAGHANANIGGAATDRVIFDFDIQHGAERLDVFPATRAHLSGRGNGNVHLVYRPGGDLARQIKPGANVLGPGIDIRAGEGSYVVLPPSIHPEGGAYTVANPEVPEHVLTDDDVRAIFAAYGVAVPGERKAPGAGLDGISRDLPDGGAWFGGSRTLERLQSPPERGAGGTNDWLTKVAGHYALQYRGDRAMYEFHVRAAAARVDPDYEDTNKVLNSVWDAEQSKPDEFNGDPSSWEPRDLTDVVSGLVSGTRVRLRPTVGQTTTGEALFYAGRVNGVAGASGDGKSWTALHTCAQVLAAGDAAFYIDYEDSEDGIVTRLLQLGVEPQSIIDRFVYRNPDVGLGNAALEELLAHVEQVGPVVVVVDSTGEALAAEGVNPNADEEVAKWFQRVARAVAKLGPAVVLLDHLVKSPDGGLWPAGSQRKRAAISGAQYIQKVPNGDGFSEAKSGRAELKCAKDRPGTYYKGQVVAHLQVTPMTGHGHGNLLGSVLTELVKPSTPSNVTAEEAEALHEKVAADRARFTEGMDTKRVLAFVEDSGGMTKNALEEAFKSIRKDGRTPIARDGKRALGREKARALAEQAVVDGLIHHDGAKYRAGAALNLGEADE